MREKIAKPLSWLPHFSKPPHHNTPAGQAGRNAELAASEPQPAALPPPLACELTWGDRVPETESQPEL